MKENEINETMRYWINLLSNIKSNESSTYFQVPMTHLNTMIIFNSITLLNTYLHHSTPQMNASHFFSSTEIAFRSSPLWVWTAYCKIFFPRCTRTANIWHGVFLTRWTNKLSIISYVTWDRASNYSEMDLSCSSLEMCFCIDTIK